MIAFPKNVITLTFRAAGESKEKAFENMAEFDSTFLGVINSLKFNKEIIAQVNKITIKDVASGKVEYRVSGETDKTLFDMNNDEKVVSFILGILVTWGLGVVRSFDVKVYSF